MIDEVVSRVTEKITEIRESFDSDIETAVNTASSNIANISTDIVTHTTESLAEWNIETKV
jgi:hypothetical protein